MDPFDQKAKRQPAVRPQEGSGPALEALAPNVMVEAEVTRSSKSRVRRCQFSEEV